MPRGGNFWLFNSILLYEHAHGTEDGHTVNAQQGAAHPGRRQHTCRGYAATVSVSDFSPHIWGFSKYNPFVCCYTKARAHKSRQWLPHLSPRLGLSGVDGRGRDALRRGRRRGGDERRAREGARGQLRGEGAAARVSRPAPAAAAGHREFQPGASSARRGLRPGCAAPALGTCVGPAAYHVCWRRPGCAAPVGRLCPSSVSPRRHPADARRCPHLLPRKDGASYPFSHSWCVPSFGSSGQPLCISTG